MTVSDLEDRHEDHICCDCCRRGRPATESESAALTLERCLGMLAGQGDAEGKTTWRSFQS